MTPANPNRARRDLKRFVKQWGTPITLKWLEFPAGTVDPTTGALTDGSPVARQCDTKAMLHFVSPAMTVSRMFADIQTGDCILDLVTAFFRVENAGDSGLVAGAVMDEFTLLRANNGLSAGQTPAFASEVPPGSFKSLEVHIAGERWVQQKTGEELARTWDALFAGVKFSQSFLLRKAT